MLHVCILRGWLSIDAKTYAWGPQTDRRRTKSGRALILHEPITPYLDLRWLGCICLGSLLLDNFAQFKKDSRANDPSPPILFSTLLWSNMRRWQVNDLQRRKVSDIWGKFMFGLCSCSLPQEGSSRTTLELSSPTRPRPAWAAIQLLARRFKVLELAWGPQCQF